MRKLILIILTFISFSFSSNSQEFESALIPKEDGAVFAFTSNEKSFTIDLNATTCILS